MCIGTSHMYFIYSIYLSLVHYSYITVHFLFQAAMQDDQLQNADLLVFANKQDLYVQIC